MQRNASPTPKAIIEKLKFFVVCLCLAREEEKKRHSLSRPLPHPVERPLADMALNNRSQLVPSNVNSSAVKEAEAILRGPLTRRQKTLAKKRDANEESSMLLKLNEDLLGNVLEFLPGKDLAVLETVCTHFRYGSWVAVYKDAMSENTAKRKLEKMELGDMPPGFRCVFDGEKVLFFFFHSPTQRPSRKYKKGKHISIPFLYE